MSVNVEIGDEIYVCLSRAHRSVACVTDIGDAGGNRITYLVLDSSHRPNWSSGFVSRFSYMISWCHNDPDEIAALETAEALR